MHSVLFEIPRLGSESLGVGPVAVHAYGTMLALAFIVALVGLQWLARRLGTLDGDQAVNLTLGILVSGVLGARILFVLLNYRTQYAARPIEALFIWQGGLAFHGGVVAALVYATFAARKMRMSMGAMADSVTPWLAFGYSITKIGCFLNGCCHGRPTGSGWGVCFPVNPGDTNLLTPLSHPVQLYDSAMNVAVGLFLLWFVLHRRRWNGQAFTLWLLLYSVTRIVADYFRYYPDNRAYSTADALPGLERVAVIGGITEAQFTSVALIIASTVALLACRRLTLRDRSDVVFLPAFSLGSLPVMLLLFGWLATQANATGHPAGATRNIVIGILYLLTVVAVTVHFLRERRRLPAPATALEPTPEPAPPAAPQDVRAGAEADAETPDRCTPHDETGDRDQ